ncbi:MAG TPA: STAS domain-containing protein [Steroidobacteraceae bacterium]|nr:STAS domain-containing protein [Steroidobacteraceae bacterium]
MPATVKRVAKKRSNNKPARPKTKGAPQARTIVSESVESMPVVASAPATKVESAMPPASTLACGKVVLGASCTIHEAPALRSHLIDQASHPGPYELDGTAVQQIDTAGLQLVVAFALDCLEKGVHYIWTGRSAALDEAIRTLGVGALLESPGAATNYSAPGAA